MTNSPTEWLARAGRRVSAEPRRAQDLGARDRVRVLMAEQINAVHRGDAAWTTRAMLFAQRAHHQWQVGTIRLRSAVAAAVVASAGLMAAQHHASTALAEHAQAQLQQAKINQWLLREIASANASLESQSTSSTLVDDQTLLFTVSFSRKGSDLVAEFSLQTQPSSAESEGSVRAGLMPSTCRFSVHAKPSESMLALAQMEDARRWMANEALPLGMTPEQVAQSAEVFLLGQQCLAVLSTPAAVDAESPSLSAVPAFHMTLHALDARDRQSEAQTHSDFAAFRERDG